MGDIGLIRELSRQVAEIAARPVQDQRRALWRRHNSLEATRPMVLCLWWCAVPEIITPQLRCEDPFFRDVETSLRIKIFQDFTEDDYVIEPFYSLRAVQKRRFPRGTDIFGLPYPRTLAPDTPGGAYRIEPSIRDLKDIERLHPLRHEIDEEETSRRADRLREAMGDILPVHVDRSPFFRDIGNVLGRMRGIEQVMWDMYDNPEWLHRLLAFFRDCVLETGRQAEEAGDYTLANHTDVPPPYEKTLKPPEANGKPVRRSELFGWFNAQEYAQVSPAQHDEFMLQYQIPYMERFAMIHYGCCEDLTNKIGILRKVKNLRRIAVGPWADVGRCAEQIGSDYVISWQPNPSDMGCCGFDPDRVRRIVRDALEKMRGCHVDIVYKDVQTVGGHPENLREWTRVVRSVSE